MEVPGRCESCGEESMVLDAIYGVMACDACGRVGNQAETELRSEWQTGHVIERGGTYVGEMDSGVGAAKGLMRGQISHTFHTGSPQWSERYRAETMKKVESITALLRVPGDRVDQAKQLLEATLDGDWGTGRWVDILVAACIYVVIRRSQLPLTVPEVADCVNCDVIELGRMYNRVLQKLEINLPTVDAVVFLERAASTLPALNKLSKEFVRKMTKQGTLLLNCAQEWFITTGRRPLPVVAAVLSLVVEANKVVVDIAEVARELHAGLWATKKRYKECQAALIGFGQSLPWGKDITLKTVPRHLPFLLKYLELKMKLEKKKKEQGMLGKFSGSGLEGKPSSDEKSLGQLPDSSVPQRSVVSCNPYSIRVREEHMQTAEVDELSSPSSKQSFESELLGAREGQRPAEDGDGTKRHPTIPSRDHEHNDAADSFVPIFQEKPRKRLKMMEVLYSTAEEQLCSTSCRLHVNEDTSTEVNVSSSDNQKPIEGIPESTEPTPISRQNSAESGLPVTLQKKELKWDGLPVAFCASLEARTRRRLKIDRAKSRIFEARQALISRFGRTACSFGTPVSGRTVQERLQAGAEQVKKQKAGLDWEDLTIEHLLLCGAGEAELENGYYQSLLSQYPEQKDTNEFPETKDADLMDEDLDSYLRSRSEVEFLLELSHHGEAGSALPLHQPALWSSPP